jgi:hypothetical protein
MNNEGLVETFEEFVAECTKAHNGEFSTANGGWALPNDNVKAAEIGFVFYRQDPLTKKEYYRPIMIRISNLSGELGKRYLETYIKNDKEYHSIFVDFIKSLEV